MPARRGSPTTAIRRSGAELQDLADFYAVRYDLDVGILPAAPIPAGLEERISPASTGRIASWR